MDKVVLGTRRAKQHVEMLETLAEAALSRTIFSPRGEVQLPAKKPWQGWGLDFAEEHFVGLG